MKAGLLILALGVAAWGQPSFEAASIKLDTSGRRGGGVSLSPGRMKVINSTLKFCVVFAWDVKDFQVAGATGWMDSDRYNIGAVAAAPFKRAEGRQMLQALLADRFGLVIHHETQDRQGYALVVAKNGPKLPPPVDDPSTLLSRTESGDRTLTAKNATMDDLAGVLSNVLGGKVVNATGLEGRFDVSFQWTPDATMPQLSKSGEPMPAAPPDAAGPSIFTALQEKLGLRLEARKVPTDIVVIDRAHRPSEN